MALKYKPFSKRFTRVILWFCLWLLSTGCITPPSELPIPPQMRGIVEGDRRVFELTLQQGSSVFLPGQTTPTWGVNGAFLGPTIRVKKGEKVAFRVKNTLGETTTLHWHGLHIPAKMDGGPHQPIGQGETWEPFFTIIQRASLNWYHPHLDHKTGLHVYRGVAGMFWIDDEISEKLPLPKEYGIDDIPLIFQDRSFNPDGSFKYISGNMEKMVGVKGTHILVNGAHKPTFHAPAQVIRLRLLNGSNGRLYNIGLENNQPFYQIATEGGLLEKPVELTRLPLSPGERAEILVDFRGFFGKTIQIKSYSSETLAWLDRDDPKGGMHADSYDATDFSMMTLSISKPTQHNLDIPMELTTIQRLDPKEAEKIRTFELDIKGPMGSKQDFTINNQTMDMQRIDAIVKLGSVEIWEIKNVSDMPHPFHIHKITFLILDRDGKPPGKHEQGWKDTVFVHLNETVRVIAKFENFADPTTPYMFHCHILEHEDGGMMGQFLVVE